MAKFPITTAVWFTASSTLARYAQGFTLVNPRVAVGSRAAAECAWLRQGCYSSRQWLSSLGASDEHEFQKGDHIQVEVVSFGPMGASVDIVAKGHTPDDLIGDADPPLGRGLILQSEIGYFRAARDNVDVVVGELLPAYVEKVRDNYRLDVSLRVIGGKAKADQVSKMILDELEWTPGGVLPIGDKSSPKAIAETFPGVVSHDWLMCSDPQ